MITVQVVAEEDPPEGAGAAKTKKKKKTKGAEVKTRVFRATLLAHCEADGLWEQSGGDTIRPVWAVLASGEVEARAVVANVRMGAKLDEEIPGKPDKRGQRFEVLRSAGYLWSPPFAVQYGPPSAPQTALGYTVYMPELIKESLGLVDPLAARFVLSPRANLPALQMRDDVLGACLAHVMAVMDFGEEDVPVLRRYLRLAPLFADYLVAHSRAPMLRDTRFFAQILCRALTMGLATRAERAEFASKWGINPKLGFFEYGVEAIGLHPGLAFQAKQEEVQALLADNVEVFGDTVGLAHAGEV